MFELAVIICRYLFIFYIGYFLLEGFFYILSERGFIEMPLHRCASMQRVIIVFNHLTAFLILAYVKNTYSFDYEILIFASLSLAFLIGGQFFVYKFYKNSCPLLWNSVFYLLDIGIITLVRLDFDLAIKQIIWLLTAFTLTLVIPFALKLIPKFENLEILYLVLAFALLVSPMFFGVRKFGALNWINIYGFKFQPSEIVKFIYIFYLASAFRKKMNLRELLFSAIASAVFVGVLVLQKDLGGALIFFMTFLVISYISTGNVVFTSAAFAAASLASYASYFMFSHIKVRISAWQNPWQNADGSGYQVIRSLFAITTYGGFGSGLTRGIPSSIPVVESDFIFSAICEEFGSFLGIGIIFVYILIFYRGVHIALRAHRKYYSLLAAGFTSILAFQTFLIIGGVIKFIPLTGVTLPFVSYGGSSILVCFLMIGILQWVYVNEGLER